MRWILTFPGLAGTGGIALNRIGTGLRHWVTALGYGTGLRHWVAARTYKVNSGDAVRPTGLVEVRGVIAPGWLRQRWKYDPVKLA